MRQRDAASFCGRATQSAFLFFLLCAPVHAASDAWTLTFQDEFSGHRLNPAIWNISHGPDNNNADPVQFYTPSDVSVQGGLLHIRTEKRTAHGLPFTSGEIGTRSKFAQKYGRFDVRCRFPSTPGTWSAVYLLPDNGQWPPEIDITEWIGRDPHTIYLTYHWRSPDGRHQMSHHYRQGADWTAWHTYRLEWGPGTMRWYIDGTLCGTTTEADGGPHFVSAQPMYLRINTAVGGSFAHAPAASLWPQEFLVDWVRVYRRAGRGK